MPSLRDWLTRKQKETWRGRAELRLTERTSQWGRSHESRFLPSLPEYLAIVCGVPRGKCTPQQRAMLRAATRRHSLRWGSLAAALVLIAVIVQQFISRARAENDHRRAESLVEAVLTAPPDAVPYAIENLRPIRHAALPILRERLVDGSRAMNPRLHAALALAALGHVEEGFLVDAIADAPSAESRYILNALVTHRETAASLLAARVSEETRPQAKARLALSLVELGDSTAARELVRIGPDPANRTAFIHQVIPTWQVGASKLREVLRESTDSALRYSICLGIAVSPTERFSAGERRELGDVLRKLFHQARDGATRNAAGCALRQLRGDLPKRSGTVHSPNDNQDWYVLDDLEMTLVRVPAGQFTIGSRTDEINRLNDESQVPVTISRDFWLSDTEVTQRQWNDVMATRPWSGKDHVKDGDDYPTTYVNWNDASEFCQKLTQRERAASRLPPGFEYRLPTEAQWEYACRAGAMTAYCYGLDEDALGTVAWFARNTGSHAKEVGRKLPNAWGLHDMHGNVWEWCRDWYEVELPGGTDPDVREVTKYKANYKVFRGGSWNSGADFCRAAMRKGYEPVYRDFHIGFRVAAVRVAD